MNKTQLQYATHRLDQAAAEKLSALRDTFVKKGKPFNGTALVAAIKSGKVTVRPGSEGRNIERYTDISDVLTGYESIATPDVLDDKAYAKACAPINAEVTRIRDQLYLGDAKEALALIEAFVAKKF